MREHPGVSTVERQEERTGERQEERTSEHPEVCTGERQEERTGTPTAHTVVDTRNVHL